MADDVYSLKSYEEGALIGYHFCIMELEDAKAAFFDIQLQNEADRIEMRKTDGTIVYLGEKIDDGWRVTTPTPRKFYTTAMLEELGNQQEEIFNEDAEEQKEIRRRNFHPEGRF